MTRSCWLALALGASLSGCSSAGYHHDSRPSARRAAPTGAVVLYVRNDHAEDIRVFLVRGSTQIPIGAVRSFNTRRFVIPPAQVGMNGTLEVVARALGSGEIARPAALDIEPGAEAFLWVENNLKYSRLLPGTLRPH